MHILLIAFIIITTLNLLGFAWAYTHQSDHSTDLLYSLSFLVTAWSVLWLEQNFSLPALLLVIVLSLWAIRLGGYLFTRIKKIKRDQRFDAMRKKFWSFLGFWILQITTVWMVLLPLLFFLSKKNVQINTFFIVGMVIWLGGFGLESVADYQKSRFKSNPNNKSKFISTGLWSVVRYPNYLGEILCWSGIFVSISSSLVGLEWLTIISPVWIAVLLIFVSGIPLLQQSQAARYGHLESFKTYIKKTARLIPFVW